MTFRSVRSLVFRELYLCRKNIITMLFMFFFLALLAFLAVLSLDYGNMKTLLSICINSVGETAVTEEIRNGFVFAAKLYPLLMLGFIPVTFCVACDADEKGKWQHFYRSTPITPLIKTAPTYIILIAFNILAFGAALGFNALICAAAGISVTDTDIALVTDCIAFGDLFGVLMSIGIKLFHSKDKAVIFLVSVCFVSIVGGELIYVFSNPTRKHGEEAVSNMLDDISGLLVNIMPYAIIAIAASLVLGFIATVFVYKRREK